MINITYNADDFGISPGVNQAIQKAHTEGMLNSTSIMINMKWTDKAVQMAKEMPNLAIGLHGNLTNQYSVLPWQEIPLLVDKNNKFKHGFVKLFLIGLLHPFQLKKQAKKEIEAQINKAASYGIKLQHLDSHRHVHMIPAIFKAFLELKQQYNIPRIRFINENPFRSIAFSESKEWIKDGALIKSFILSFCGVINKILYRYKSDTYFYSIIHTCKISAQRIKELKVPPIYKKAEIMLHPGMPEIDKQFKEDIFDDNILNDWRSIELQALLNNKVKKNKK